MAENELTEDQKLAALRTEQPTVVINTEEGVVNKVPELVVEEKKDEVVVEKPYWETKGFSTQAELDTYIEQTKVTPKSSYTSKYAEKFDSFVKATGKDDPKLFEFYENTQITDTMEPKDYVRLIVEKEIQQNPSLVKYKDIRTEELNKEYLLDFDPNEDGVTTQDLYQKEMKNIQLKGAAQGVIDDIKTTQEKMANSGLTQAEIDTNKVKFEEAKTKSIEFINKSVTDLNLDVFDGKKNDKGEFEIAKDDKGQSIVLKSFTFEQEEKDFFKAALEGVITQMGFPEPGSDNANYALRLAKMATKEEFEVKRIKEVIAQTEARMTKKDKIDTDNPSILKTPAVSTDNDKILSEEESISQARNWRR